MDLGDNNAMRTFFLLRVVLFGIAIGVTTTNAQQKALVSVDAVIEQPFAQTVPILGNIVAKQSGTVASRINGAVQDILVQVGDRVTSDQLIAIVDTEPLKLAVELEKNRKQEAEARITTAKAQLALASQDVKRLSGLQSSAAVSKAALDDAEQQKKIAFARVREAEAAVSSSNAALQVARLQLGYGNIVAPFNGTVTEKMTEIGSYLQRGSAVVRLVSDRLLELEADIPSNRLGGLAVGREIAIRFDNGEQHSATVRAVVPEENPRTRTRVVRFNIELPETTLAIAQSVTLQIPAGASRDIVSVHKDGIIRKGKAAIVYVVEDEVAKLRPVTVGAAVGGRLEVISGIAPGDQVVVRGNERLRPDQAVTIGGQQPAS